MPTKESKTKYDMNYAKTKLKRIPLDVQKEKYEQIKAAADLTGESVNGYIKKLLMNEWIVKNNIIQRDNDFSRGKNHENFSTCF